MKQKCDKCGKPATTTSVDIINGQKIKKHLCDDCVAEEPGMPYKPVHTPINELLTSFVKMHSGGGGGGAAQQAVTKDVACDHCGTTWAQFQEKSLLGCPQCYTAFERILAPLLERAHEGGSSHLGKSPRRGGVGGEQRQLQLTRLRKRLSEAIEAEDYELAASLRDEINTCEGSGAS